MEPSPRLIPLLSILVAVALAVFAVAAFFVPSLVRLLPWAGVLAGLLAVLQSVNLRNAAPAVRWTLAFAGSAAVVFMFAVLTFQA